jgi:hypothetical protein
MKIMGLDDSMTHFEMDPADLYHEETFTDRKAGTIRRLLPVKSDGSTDKRREVLYLGQTQLVTPLGAVPLTFEIDAHSLKEAIEKFSAAAKVAVDHTVEELTELRRQAASSIVIPEAGSGGLGGVGGISGGGGKIKLP